MVIPAPADSVAHTCTVPSPSVTLIVAGTDTNTFALGTRKKMIIMRDEPELAFS